MLDWLHAHEVWLPWIEVAAVVGFFGSLVLLPLLIVRIPSDYFARIEAPPSRWARHHPLLRLGVRVARNVIGFALIAFGAALLMLPGQGLLTILVGVSLADFPGKRRLEMWFVARRGILKALNWIRAKAHHAPLETPHSDA